MEPPGHARVILLAVRERRGEAEAGQRRHDHVEGVGGVAAERGRISERADHLAPVPEGPGPAVQEQQGDRRGALSLLADEVHGSATDVHRVVGVRVQLGLDAAPVESIGPVLDDRLREGCFEAVRPVVVVEVRREPGGAQPGSEVVEHVLLDVHDERLETTFGCLIHRWSSLLACRMCSASVGGQNDPVEPQRSATAAGDVPGSSR